MAVKDNPSEVRALNSTGDFSRDRVISLKSEYTLMVFTCIPGI